MTTLLLHQQIAQPKFSLGLLLFSIRCFSKKGEGPSRNQTLITTAVNVLETLNDETKGTTGAYLKVGSIEGPSFSSTEDAPLFMGRIETSYVATVLS